MLLLGLHRQEYRKASKKQGHLRVKDILHVYAFAPMFHYHFLADMSSEFSPQCSPGRPENDIN